MVITCTASVFMKLKACAV